MAVGTAVGRAAKSAVDGDALGIAIGAEDGSGVEVIVDVKNVDNGL